MAFSINGIPLGGNPLKPRRVKFGLGVTLAMILVGAAFTAVGLLLVDESRVDEGWERINGTVVGAKERSGSDSTTYSAVVSYEVDGTPYTVTSGTGSSIRPSMGSTKEVAYDPSDPARSKVVGGSETIFAYIFPTVGLLLIGGAVFGYLKSRKRSQSIKQLTQTGQKITGVLAEVTYAGGRNNRSTYRLIVAATDPQGNVRHYTSDAVTGAVGISLTDFLNNPVPIDVYINPTNPDEYYVDLSDIPELDPKKILELISRGVGNSAPTPTGLSGAPLSTPPITPAVTPQAPAQPHAQTPVPPSTPPQAPTAPVGSPDLPPRVDQS